MGATLGRIRSQLHVVADVHLHRVRPRRRIRFAIRQETIGFHILQPMPRANTRQHNTCTCGFVAFPVKSQMKSPFSSPSADASFHADSTRDFAISTEKMFCKSLASTLAAAAAFSQCRLTNSAASTDPGSAECISQTCVSVALWYPTAHNAEWTPLSRLTRTTSPFAERTCMWLTRESIQSVRFLPETTSAPTDHKRNTARPK